MIAYLMASTFAPSQALERKLSRLRTPRRQLDDKMMTNLKGLASAYPYLPASRTFVLFGTDCRKSADANARSQSSIVIGTSSDTALDDKYFIFMFRSGRQALPLPFHCTTSIDVSHRWRLIYKYDEAYVCLANTRSTTKYISFISYTHAHAGLQSAKRSWGKVYPQVYIS